VEGRNRVRSNESFDIGNIRLIMERFTLHIVSQNACDEDL
jgi:hypothetical protein